MIDEEFIHLTYSPAEVDMDIVKWWYLFVTTIAKANQKKFGGHHHQMEKPLMNSVK